jgi:hypothetical protein
MSWTTRSNSPSAASVWLPCRFWPAYSAFCFSAILRHSLPPPITQKAMPGSKASCRAQLIEGLVVLWSRAHWRSLMSRTGSLDGD